MSIVLNKFFGGNIMGYTIKEASKITGLSTSTLRYYDREGLLPFIKRLDSGYRSFSEDDIEMIKIIECLKRTGMSIKEIKKFTEWVQDGDNSLEERYEMFLERKHAVETEIESLQNTLDIINYKCWYYKTAIEAGTEKIHFKNKKDGKLPCE